MIYLGYLVVALAGLGAGVVVNALADRIAGDEEPPWAAGYCRKCGKPLPAARFFPLLNLRADRRRCASCGSVASLRRPLIELALAITYPLLLAHLLAPESAGHVSPWLTFVVDGVLCAVLAFTFVVDLEHHLIYDIAIYPPALLLVGVALLFDHKALAGILFGIVLYGGLFLLLYGLGFLLYRTEALGLGDVKLAALIGMLAGWPGVITAIVLATLFGTAFSLIVLGISEANSKSYIPYGTAMSLGAVLTLLMTHPLW